MRPRRLLEKTRFVVVARNFAYIKMLCRASQLRGIIVGGSDLRLPWWLF